jgi:hypothetical protein
MCEISVLIRQREAVHCAGARTPEAIQIFTHYQKVNNLVEWCARSSSGSYRLRRSWTNSQSTDFVENWEP